MSGSVDDHSKALAEEEMSHTKPANMDDMELKCEECGNFKAETERAGYDGLVFTGKCANFEPKQHPLETLVNRIGINGPETKKLAAELRYESIKWALGNASDGFINHHLRNHDHADWIPDNT